MAYDRQHYRAGASACGRRAPLKRGADAQGRSCGGLGTKIHAATEALGLPVRLIGSPGQRNDIAFAHDLIDGFPAAAVLAEKGYDGDHLCESLVETGAGSLIVSMPEIFPFAPADLLVDAANPFIVACAIVEEV